MDVLQVLERVITARAARHGRGDGRREGIFAAVFRGAQRGEGAEAEIGVMGEGLLQLKKGGALKGGEARGGKSGGGGDGAGQAAAQEAEHLGVCGFGVWLCCLCGVVV